MRMMTKNSTGAFSELLAATGEGVWSRQLKLRSEKD